MALRKNPCDIALDVLIYTIAGIISISAFIPFLCTVSKSFSEEWAVVSGKVLIFPVGFQLDTMKMVLKSGQFYTSFQISVFVTIIGTLASLFISAVTAYPLSKRNLPGVSGILVLYIFTMMFNGGIIPNYMLIKNLNLINHLSALILPSLISVFCMLVIKTHFENIPESLEESAKLDGASNTLIFFRIILPLSKPVLATMGLFYAVYYWNDYFNAMLYINKSSLKPLQLYLRDIVVGAVELNNNLHSTVSDKMNIPLEGMRAATIVAATVPILLVYPFLQKYFVKGMMIGSVKG